MRHKTEIRKSALLLALSVCIGLTGCFGFLKPVKSAERHFILNSLPGTAAGATSVSLAVRVSQVKLPAYLINSALAIRKGTNEIDYSRSALWAEQLDIGMQRVLEANLVTLLHTGQRPSASRSADASAELYVTVEQFDVDSAGKGVFSGGWQIRAPDGTRILKTGTSRFKQQGPSLEADPSGAVGTLSALLAEFSRELAQAVNKITSSPEPDVKGGNGL